jgi:predicted alpha/beta-fold hydrolase
MGKFLPEAPVELPWQGSRLDLEDGDALALRTLEGRTGVVVHLFHGLGGSADGAYMRRAAALLHARGHGVVAVNHRGAGEGRGLARRSYHSGSTGDLAAVLAHSRARRPGQRLLAVGFSISASQLLLLLGRDHPRGLLDGAIAVNPPADLEACSLRLGQGFNRVYDQYFIHRLRREVLSRPGAEALPPTPTLRAFDEAYTAPQAGFPSRLDYYRSCSCGPHLAGIQVPTVILTALDDPIAPGRELEAAPRSPWVHLHVERTGGHMGYLGRGVPGLRWLEYALDHYLASLIAGDTAKA